MVINHLRVQKTCLKVEQWHNPRLYWRFLFHFESVFHFESGTQSVTARQQTHSWRALRPRLLICQRPDSHSPGRSARWTAYHKISFSAVTLLQIYYCLSREKCEGGICQIL